MTRDDQHTAQTQTVFRRICPICEAKCGLLVYVDPQTGTVLQNRGDPDDPASRGYICPKGVAVKDVHDDPDLVRTPLIKRNGVFEPASWAEAMEYSATRLKAIQDQHGKDAVGFFIGNGFANNSGMMLYLGLFLEAVGSRQAYTSASLDQLSRLVAVMYMYGGSGLLPIPDIDRTTFFVAHGANPIVSNGSLMTAPGIPDRLRDLRRRGGKLVVIDPRFNETARVADQHIPIRPGTDAPFLLACINHLFASGQVKLGRLAEFSNGLETVRNLVEDFTPESVEDLCGVPAAALRDLVDAFAGAESAVWYGRTGTCTQRFGTLTNWLLELMHILTGNLDRVGGAMFPAGAIPPMAYAETLQGGVAPFGRWRSRVNGLPELCGILPSAALPDEILGPGEGQMRGFIAMGGNPVICAPNGAKLDEALASLDFMLAVDIYINETTRHADVILPNASTYSESNYYLMHIAFMVRSWVKWTPPVFPDSGDQLKGWEIMRGLAAHLTGQDEDELEETFVRNWLKGFIAGGEHPRAAEIDLEAARSAIGDTPGPDRLYDVLIRTGRYGDAFGLDPEGLTVERLAQHPEGLDMGPMTPQLPGKLRTPDGKIDLAPGPLVADLDRLRAWMAEPKGDGLLLIGRRHARSKNSWMHNIEMLARGKDRCTLIIHPKDAEPLHIADGDVVKVFTDLASIEIAAEVSDQIMPGVVSIPHGRGHGQAATSMQVANARPGVNVNALLSEDDVDPASASNVLNGVRVRVARAVDPVIKTEVGEGRAR
jgi:anaerobic selenocysteine-containing dehydrogenase